MDDKDFQRIEEMMSRNMGRLRGEIAEDFRHQLGVQREDYQHKLDLVVEGQQMLAEKVDRVEGSLKEEIRKVAQGVTAVAVDLAAHRKDTEGHKGYRVCEDLR